MNDLSLLDKLSNMRGTDTRELAMLAEIVIRSDSPTAEALILMLNEKINELHAEVRRLKPVPNMRRMG